jgi:hypothetical protein
MPSCKRLMSSIAILLAIFIASPTRAGDFKEDNSKITIHAPDGWKKSEEKETEAVMKLTLQKGVPEKSDDYYVLKIGHVVIDEDATVEQFKDGMIKSFPADWKSLGVTKVTVGTDKLPALCISYSFLTSGIPFRMDMYLFRRGRQFTFFQFVGTEKAYDGLHDELHKIVADAEITSADSK